MVLRSTRYPEAAMKNIAGLSIRIVQVFCKITVDRYLAHGERRDPVLYFQDFERFKVHAEKSRLLDDLFERKLFESNRIKVIQVKTRSKICCYLQTPHQWVVYKWDMSSILHNKHCKWQNGHMEK